MSASTADDPDRNNRPRKPAAADRRQQIIAAAWRVICRDGVSAASLRTIAAEMDATTGLVTRYFPEKQALLLAALDEACQRLCRAIKDASANYSKMAQVEAVLLAALPVSPESRAAWRVWLAFIGELAPAPELARAHGVFPGALRQLLVHGLREAQLAGQIAQDTYPPQLADMALSQVVGLAVRGISEPDRYPAEKLPGLMAPFFARFVDRLD
ncbi:MAG: TetR/AcrR family transcriptional regulator [Alphaproteobacteria bacterium]